LELFVGLLILLILIFTVISFRGWRPEEWTWLLLGAAWMAGNQFGVGSVALLLALVALLQGRRRRGLPEWLPEWPRALQRGAAVAGLLCGAALIGSAAASLGQVLGVQDPLTPRAAFLLAYLALLAMGWTREVRERLASGTVGPEANFRAAVVFAVFLGVALSFPWQIVHGLWWDVWPRWSCGFQWAHDTARPVVTWGLSAALAGTNAWATMTLLIWGFLHLWRRLLRDEWPPQWHRIAKALTAGLIVSGTILLHLLIAGHGRESSTFERGAVYSLSAGAVAAFLLRGRGRFVARAGVIAGGWSVIPLLFLLIGFLAVIGIFWVGPDISYPTGYRVLASFLSSLGIPRYSAFAGGYDGGGCIPTIYPGAEAMPWLLLMCWTALPLLLWLGFWDSRPGARGRDGGSPGE
jgi:hypothetical protein